MYEGSGYKYNCFFYNLAFVLKFWSGVSLAIVAQLTPRLRTKVTHIFPLINSFKIVLLLQ